MTEDPLDQGPSPGRGDGDTIDPNPLPTSTLPSGTPPVRLETLGEIGEPFSERTPPIAARKLHARDRVAIVVAGHVDHGKSSLVGRLLVETGSLPEGKLERVRAHCERRGQAFEYAYLVDALRDERSDGVTIDVARVFFQTEARDYVLLDPPGHAELQKSLVTGAGRAVAAILVVDAAEGVRESSRRHATMLSLLGVSQVIVVVTKMDAVAFSHETFDAVVTGFSRFASLLGLEVRSYVPTSAPGGDNIATRSSRMPWYEGPSLIEELDALEGSTADADGPLRLPVQDVYSFASAAEGRRIVAGTVASGMVEVGDELVFYPSRKRAHVATIEAFGEPPPMRAATGKATGITLLEPIFVTRGEIACRASEVAPAVATRLVVSLFWLGAAPLARGKELVFKLGTNRTLARVVRTARVLDAATLEPRPTDVVARSEVAECVLELRDRVACDLSSDLRTTSRFVLAEGTTIVGGGVVREVLPDPGRESFFAKPLGQGARIVAASALSPVDRRRAVGHASALVVVTGPAPDDVRAHTRALEAALVGAGKHALAVTDTGQVIPRREGRQDEDSTEDAPRDLARVLQGILLLLEAGLLVILDASTSTLSLADLREAVQPHAVVTVAVGAPPGTDERVDVQVADGEREHDVVIRFLASSGLLTGSVPTWLSGYPEPLRVDVTDDEGG